MLIGRDPAFGPGRVPVCIEHTSWPANLWLGSWLGTLLWFCIFVFFGICAVIYNNGDAIRAWWKALVEEFNSYKGGDDK